jgi:hypothetical protein
MGWQQKEEKRPRESFLPVDFERFRERENCDYKPVLKEV